MTATLIDGKALAAKVRDEVAAEVAELGHVGLATVLVGDDPASRRLHPPQAEGRPRGVGIDARDLRCRRTRREEELLALIAELNADDGVDGLLVQLPLPGPHRREHA